MHATLVYIITMGLGAGFSHCIGMCGVFVVAYSGMGTTQAPTSNAAKHAMFHVGRLCVLTALGVLGGLVGSVSHIWSHNAGIFGIVSGIVMLVLAIAFSGIFPKLRIPEPDILGAGGGQGRRMYIKILKSDSVLKPLLIGAVVGLLPCGLTYQALILSLLTHNVVNGALIMFAFGVASLPGLLTFGVFGTTLFNGLMRRPTFRTKVTQISSALMAITAVGVILKAVSLL